MTLLVGTEAEHATRIAMNIALDLSEWLDGGGRCPIHSGAVGELAGQHAGISLVFLELSRLTGDTRWHDRARSCWARSVERIGESACGPDFFTGFTGAAWVGALLDTSARLGSADSRGDHGDDGDDLAEIDDVVLAVLRNGQETLPDLLGGVSGLGLYFATHPSRRRAIEGLELVVERLDQSALTDARGTYWSPSLSELPPGFDTTRFSSGCAPIGTAHGLSGILSVIARAIEVGAASKAATRLFDGAVRFLLTTRLNAERPFTFAATVHQDGSAAAATTSWCWGDVGIIGALYAAALRAGNPELERAMVEAATMAAGILPEAYPMRDASLCHGTAGRGHVLNRLQQSMDSDALANASREWFRATIAARGPRGFGGYEFFVHTDSELVALPSPGLLVGSAGVALALLSACSTKRPTWDMPFALDLPADACRGLQAHVE